MVSPQSATRRIDLVGEYDLNQKQELAALFRALAPDGPAVIDLTNVTYMDSTVLNELVKLRDRFKAQTVTLLVRSKNIVRLLQTVKFDKLFEVVEA